MTDDRVRPVPVGDVVERAGVRMAELRLDPRPDDRSTALVDDDDRQRVDRASPAPRGRFLARRSALRAFVAARLACDPAALSWCVQDGQRTVVAGDRFLHVSLSVSGSVAFAALAPFRVGLDVEVVRVLPDACDVAGAFFTPAEAAWVHGGATADERSRRFLRLWVRKEAVVKCTGEGLARDLASFDVLHLPDHHPVELGVPPGVVDVVDVELDGHVAAVAVPAVVGRRARRRQPEPAR